MRPLTYCNPLCIEDIPDGRPLDTEQTHQDPSRYSDYRSVSDPSVVYDNGKWYLFPSYGIAYVTEDFVHWRHIDVGVPEMRYSPAIVKFRGKWYLSGHCVPEVYSADSVEGPFTECGKLSNADGSPLSAADGCYLADGDHLYYYWHANRPPHEGEDVELITGTYGAELDPDHPWRLLSDPVWIQTYDPRKEWQRMGENHQNIRMGWIEGQWAYKRGNRYYLLYSGCGTEFSTYTNGVLYSDEGPLAGFVPQKRHDPFTEKRTGLLRGAGHGCLCEGPGGTLWTFYTNMFGFYHLYERRVSMDCVGIDEEGELYCPETTEVPGYAPGVLSHPERGNSAGLLPLTFYQRPEATSAAPGRDAFYACDDSAYTWWQPDASDPEPTLTVSLGGSSAYRVESMRLLFRDIGMDCPGGILPGPFRYIAEYAPAPDCRNWLPMVDASDNTKDLCVDYRQFMPVDAYAVRLRILGAPAGITPGVVNFTVFGNCITAGTVE